MLARRFLSVCAGVLCLAPTSVGASSQISVNYEASTLPADDPVSPWQATISGDATQSAQSGMLLLSDNNASDAYISYLRLEPGFAEHTFVQVETRVGLVSNNDWFGEPALVLMSHDPTRPPESPGHIYYIMSFYADRIELRRHLPDGASFVLASVPVADLGSTLHVVRLDWQEGVQRRFDVFLDGALVATADGEATTLPLNAISFGHGLYVGTGSSQWDYVRYWTPAPTRAADTSWGATKSRYRGSAQPLDR